MKAALVGRRYVLLVLLGVLLVGLAAVAERGGDPPVAGRLGPTPGPDSTGYVEEKTRLLASLRAEDPDRRAAALVSLDRLLRSSDVTQLAGGAPVDVVFVRFPGMNPEAFVVVGTVEVTVGSRAAEVAELLEAEIDTLEGDAEATSGEERRQILQEVVTRREQVNALRGECFCIYAFTVRGATVDALALMQGHEDVKLVDVPDPPVASLRGWELTPLLPRGAG